MASRRKLVRRGRTVSRDGPDPIDVHVGRRLRQGRLLAKVSQIDLGAGIGVSFQAVQKYETGENRLSASRLFKAARLIDHPISFFFEGLGDAVAASMNSGFSSDEVVLVRHYRQIEDERLRAQIFQMVAEIGNLGAAEPSTKRTRRKA